jgi:hypothetical protein
LLLVVQEIGKAGPVVGGAGGAVPVEGQVRGQVEDCRRPGQPLEQVAGHRRVDEADDLRTAGAEVHEEGLGTAREGLGDRGHPAGQAADPYEEHSVAFGLRGPPADHPDHAVLAQPAVPPGDGLFGHAEHPRQYGERRPW